MQAANIYSSNSQKESNKCRIKAPHGVEDGSQEGASLLVTPVRMVTGFVPFDLSRNDSKEVISLTV